MRHQKNQVARLEAMFEKDAVSAEELELAGDTMELYDIQLEIEKVQLETVQTGARAQQVDWMGSRVQALQEEIDVLKERLEACTITTPISGLLGIGFTGDTLVVVQDTTGFAVVFPVELEDRSRIASGQEIELNKPEPVFGRIEHIGNTAYTVNRRQVLGVVAVIRDRNRATLMPGLTVSCVIPCSPLGLFGCLQVFFSQ